MDEKTIQNLIGCHSVKKLLETITEKKELIDEVKPENQRIIVYLKDETTIYFEHDKAGTIKNYDVFI